MKVLADHRESTTILETFKRIGIEYEVKSLEVADYIIGGIGIERKDIKDHIDSIYDGRLSHQLHNLSRNYNLSYLVIIGSVIEALIDRKVNQKTYISSLASSSLKRAPDGKMGQVVTINLDTAHDFALFIQALKNKLESSDIIREPYIAKAKALTDDECILRIVVSLPNIGEEKAKKLIEHFGTVRKLFSANKYQLMNVEGIGETTADRLEDLFEKFYNSSETQEE